MSKGLELLKESAAFAIIVLHTADLEGAKLVIPAMGTLGNFWIYFLVVRAGRGCYTGI